jgi:hypothetical protein
VFRHLEGHLQVTYVSSLGESYLMHVYICRSVFVGMLTFIIKFNAFNFNLLMHEAQLNTQLHNLLEIACVHRLAVLSTGVITFFFNSLSRELCVTLCMY